VGSWGTLTILTTYQGLYLKYRQMALIIGHVVQVCGKLLQCDDLIPALAILQQ
jgi:hypothetical protein